VERAAHTTLQPLGGGEAAARVARAAALLERHEARLRRVASRYSSCEADAEDAFQRAAEVLLRKGPAVEQRRLLAWMHTVTRREALAVGRARPRLIARRPGAEREPADPLDALACERPGPDLQLERRERAAAAARALARLKPQERRAIALQAAGCSYAEIQAITGWTYTKVNRCLAEGRETLRRLAPLAEPA
jgi:RNA polymerase sigma factor (sigma-70 family)